MQNLKQFVQDQIQSWPKRSVVLLSGTLAAGKTEFVKQWGDLESIANVASPTFAIHNQYKKAEHFDLYRLESLDDLETTGFWDCFLEEEGLIFIEWPERLDIKQLSRKWNYFWYNISVNQNIRDIELWVKSALS